MKETLLQRCQREAREKLQATIDDVVRITDGTVYVVNTETLDEAIANTLKQVAEDLKDYLSRDSSRPFSERVYEWLEVDTSSPPEALTDAQKLLLGEDNG